MIAFGISALAIPRCNFPTGNDAACRPIKEPSHWGSSSIATNVGFGSRGAYFDGRAKQEHGANGREPDRAIKRSLKETREAAE
jgi:hypothetical protein